MVDNVQVGTADVHEEEIESRFEAALAVGLVIGLALVSLGVLSERARTSSACDSAAVASASES